MDNETEHLGLLIQSNKLTSVLPSKSFPTHS